MRARACLVALLFSVGCISLAPEAERVHFTKNRIA